MIVARQLSKTIALAPADHLRQSRSCKATMVTDFLGYLPHDPGLYECPVDLTRFRGITYIFLATLPSESVREKAILRGVAIVFKDDN